jgi:hypothetical protein
MKNVFPDDMVLDSSVELALANVDLNDPMLELTLLMMVILLMGHPPHQQMQILDWIQRRRRRRRMEQRAVAVVAILMIPTWRKTIDGDEL